MAKPQYSIYCVYRIVCSTSLKSYIGQTCNPKKRIYEHFRRLKSNQHHNLHLQSAFNQYGVDAFYSEVIETDIPVGEVDNRERYWITHFDSLLNGFNKAPGGNLAYRGKPCIWNGKRYDSISAAAFDIGINAATLHERLDKGYVRDSDIQIFGEKHNRPCVWNGIGYPSHKAAAKALGISTGAMKFRIARGYQSDSDMPQRVKCSWNGIDYRSVSECSRATDIAPATLLRWLNRGIFRDEDRPIYRKNI